MLRVLDKILLTKFNKKQLPKWRLLFETTAHVGFLLIALYVLPVLYFLSSDHIPTIYEANIDLTQNDITFLHSLNNWVPIIQMTVVAVAAIILGYIMKALILRPRPHNHVTYLGKSDSSFPSSHTSVAFGLAGLLHLYIWELSPLWWILAIFVGLGRIYIQMHYLSDVIGGIIIGLILAFLTLLYLQPNYVQFLIG